MAAVSALDSKRQLSSHEMHILDFVGSHGAHAWKWSRSRLMCARLALKILISAASSVSFI